MKVLRRDVVLVDFPFPSGAGSKVRPALVVQNDTDNARLMNTIVAQITSRINRSHEPTQVLIEVATPDGMRTGLLFDSCVNCANLATIQTDRILRKLGEAVMPLMHKVHDALKAALEVP